MKYLIMLIILYSHQLYAQFGIKRVNVSEGNYTGAKAVEKIAGIKVKVVTPDSLTLGYLLAKEGNETYRLVPEGEESRWLDSLINKRYSSQFARDGKVLLWVVNELAFSTDTAAQYRFGKLKAEVYVKNTSGDYDYLNAIDTLFNNPLARDDSFGGAITALLDVLYQSSLTTKVPSIRKMRETSTELSVLTSEVNRGVYVTYEAFRINKPSYTEAFWIEPDTTLSCGHVKLFTMTKDSVIRQLGNVWGVSFGGNELYKFEQGLLIPIEKSNAGFVLSRYKEPAKRLNQALLWRYVAASGWPADTNPFSRDKALTVKMKAGLQASPVATRIDTDSGELTF